MEKIQQWEKKSARKRQTELCEKHFENCSKFVKHISIGDPAQEILKTIEEENMDMVVICRKGESGRFKMGGVAEKIVRNSPVSVFIVSNADEK
ncbi:MAG: universal stress protein [Deltaproteobacteria bacterium]|nr:universal stress protein [Deltaproteobacteria bacterium]MBW2342772.1 universal stress protein [Deltaproteobacteria bacterium]